MKQIKTIEELKELASTPDGLECSITLNGGITSSKHIWYSDRRKVFNIVNFIDSTDQELSERELFDNNLTNIGEALNLGALYKYE